jgi:hypothetical protein
MPSRAGGIRPPATVHVAVDGVNEVVARARRRRWGGGGKGREDHTTDTLHEQNSYEEICRRPARVHLFVYL